MFSIGGNFVPQGNLSKSGNPGEVLLASSWLKPAMFHPIITGHPTTKNYVAPNIYNARLRDLTAKLVNVSY